MYEADKVVLETDGEGNQTAWNVYGTNLISRKMEEDTAYYMYNAHGDVTALIDEEGNILATYYYDAFGNIVEADEGEGVENPYRYAGYHYDTETGLYYLNARYYDSKIARFLTEDTYRGNIYDPLSLNLYTYCYNNPIKYIDPTGHAALLLEKGSKGEEVKAVQKLLMELGYDLGSSGADGIFGKKTEAAVLQFQKDYGIKVDGIVGNQTLTVLQTAVSVKNAPSYVQEQAIASAKQTATGYIKDTSKVTSVATMQPKSTSGTTNTTKSTSGTVTSPQKTTVPQAPTPTTISGVNGVSQIGNGYAESETSLWSKLWNTVNEIGLIAGSFIQGVGAGSLETMTYGESRKYDGYYARYNETAYQLGKIVGNVATGLMGVGEAGAGITYTVGTGGVGAVAGGEVLIAHGGSIAISGLKEAAENLNVLFASSKRGGNSEGTSSTGQGSNLSNQTREQLLKSKSSYEKLIQEHKAKLQDYINNPDAYDNLGLLKNVSPEVRQKIIDGRIKALEKQIQKQIGELEKIIELLK